MTTLSWNCRGLCCASTIRHLKQLVDVHKPCFLFLYETLLSLQRCWKQVRSLGFDCYEGTNVQGKRGGTILLWSNSTPCSVLSMTSNWIHVQTTINGNQSLLTFVYAPPNHLDRLPFWSSISSLVSGSALPWLLQGDFNQVLDSSEKFSNCTTIYGAKDFKDFINMSELIGLHIEGNWYT